MSIDTQKLRDLLGTLKEYPWDVDTRNEIIAHAAIAADHIDALEADNKQLREALNTIAAYPYARDQEMGAAAMRKIARAALSGEGK